VLAPALPDTTHERGDQSMATDSKPEPTPTTPAKPKGPLESTPVGETDNFGGFADKTDSATTKPTDDA
jgi:hypothetical protein